jgi:hypothetical protein
VLDDDSGAREPVVLAPADAQPVVPDAVIAVAPDAAVAVMSDAAIAVVPDAAVVAVEILRDAGAKKPRVAPSDAPALVVDAAIVAIAPLLADAAPPPSQIDENTPLPPHRFPPTKPALMENVFESMCTIPVDPSAKGLGMDRVLDWGRITRRATAIGTIGDMRRDMLLFELKGQRGTYRFDGSIDRLAALHADVGDLVVVCPDGRSNAAWELPAGWENTFPVQAVLRLSAPPAIWKFAKLAPQHIRSGTPSREVIDGKLENPAAGHYFLRAKALENTGTRWKMEGGWFLDVPPGTPGASDMGTKRMWFVITGARFDGAALIYRATAVISTMFPQ